MEKQVKEYKPDDSIVVNREIAIDSARIERRNQFQKWGVQKHDPMTWMTILGEEYGELCEQLLRAKFGKPENFEKAVANARQEAVQVAAVALAIVQYLDTGEA